MPSIPKAAATPKAGLTPKAAAALKEYKKLLAGSYVEPVFQKFLEKNPLFIPQIALLNHGLHLESIISQFPLDTSLKTDFVYITKSSVCWEIFLVEIERPDKKLFTRDLDQITPTAALTKAISQVHSWDDFLDKNRNEVIRRLEPLLVPPGMRNNRIKFRTILVIGRSHQLRKNQAMRDRWDRLSSDSLHLMTFDSLASHYRQKMSKRYKPAKPNILALSKTRFSFKYMHHHPCGFFSYLGPSELKLKPKQRTKLIAAGYDIPAWERGELLIVNGKVTKLRRAI